MHAQLEPIYDELVRSSLVAPVGLDDDEQQTFVDYELALLAEHRLGDRTDPRNIDAVRRADWLARVTHEDSRFVLPKNHLYQRCFWLLNEGERVGTIAFAPPMGAGTANCYSFYLLQAYRGRGLGSRIMLNILRTFDKHGLGIRLTTDWAWQKTIRFYRRLGFWVYHWKRELDLIWTTRLPTSRIAVGPDEMSFSVALGDSEVTLVRAHRKGDKLELDDETGKWVRTKGIEDACVFATSTLSLELAMNGWPLIRSPGEWNDSYYADGGVPEALAYRITFWEARERAKGWIVNTPRIPGLEYPTWDEFQQRWAKEEQEMAEGNKDE